MEASHFPSDSRPGWELIMQPQNLLVLGGNLGVLILQVL